jgi:hypothetical protein
MHPQKSSTLFGVGEDAAYLADMITAKYEGVAMLLAGSVPLSRDWHDAPLIRSA